MNDEPLKKEPTIRGDKLLCGFRFLEHCAGNHRKKLEKHLLTGLMYLPVRPRENIQHPFGSWHWIGEIAIRTSTRRTLEEMLSEKGRQDAVFLISSVINNAIEHASPTELGDLGLSKDDRYLLSETLHPFFCALGSGELPITAINVS